MVVRAVPENSADVESEDTPVVNVSVTGVPTPIKTSVGLETGAPPTPFSLKSSSDIVPATAGASVIEAAMQTASDFIAALNVVKFTVAEVTAARPFRALWVDVDLPGFFIKRVIDIASIAHQYAAVGRYIMRPHTRFACVTTLVF